MHSILRKYVPLLPVIISQTVFAFSIETVVAPEGGDSLTVNRSAIYRSGNTVIYGQCDSLEFECNPDSPSLQKIREMPYEEYLHGLAKRFNVPGNYLVEHEKAGATYDAYIKLLQQILDTSSTSEDEKKSAQKKFELFTSKGGVLDRFTQAVAIKRSLEWTKEKSEVAELAKSYASSTILVNHLIKHHEATKNEEAIKEIKAWQERFRETSAHSESVKTPVISFEKSVVQYEQALYPLNFAADEINKGTDRVDELSTGLTWVFVGGALTYHEAVQACESLEGDYRIPTYYEGMVGDLPSALPWLLKSHVAALIPAGPNKATPRVWIRQSRVGDFKKTYVGKQRRNVEIGFRSFTEKDVDIYHYNYGFRSVEFKHPAKSVVTYVSTKEEKENKEYLSDVKYTNITERLPTLCVGTKRN